MKRLAPLAALCLLPSCALLRPTATVTWVRSEPVLEARGSAAQVWAPLLAEVVKQGAVVASPWALTPAVLGALGSQALDNLKTVRGEAIHISVPCPRGAGVAVKMTDGKPEAIIVQPIVPMVEE